MLICHCFRITRAQMASLVRDRGLTTVEQVAEATGACRGCCTCRPEIEAILRAENPVPPAAPAPGATAGE